MSRLLRFRDRGSYKSSEVVALFLVSLFAGMIFCGMCAAIDYAINTLILHRTG
jgi:hypothetical protein